MSLKSRLQNKVGIYNKLQIAEFHALMFSVQVGVQMSQSLS